MKRFLIIIEVNYSEQENRIPHRRIPFDSTDINLIKAALQQTFDDAAETLISDNGPTVNVQVFEGISSQE